MPYFDNDLLLVLGVVILGFSFPSLLSAYSESRPPRVAAMLLVIGGGLIGWVATRTAGGISVEDVPRAFVAVIGRFTN